MKETLSGDMTGKICLVTGATNGIGKATAMAPPIAIAEIAFPLWLLIKGVNAKQWQKRVSEPSDSALGCPRIQSIRLPGVTA